jgi:hypothetical protein
MANAPENSSVVVGHMAEALKSGGIAIGKDSLTSNTNAIAIGKDAKSSGTGSISLGNSSNSTGISSIALGENAVANLNNSIVLNASGNILTSATGSSFYVNPIRNSTGSQVLHYNNVTKEITYSTPETSNVKPGTCDSDYLYWSVSEQLWKAGGTAIHIGCGATASNNSVAIGVNSKANYDNSIVIGRDAYVTAPMTTVINSSGVGVTGSNTGAFYVSPIRKGPTGATGLMLAYNSVTKEVTYRPIDANNAVETCESDYTYWSVSEQLWKAGGDTVRIGCDSGFNNQGKKSVAIGNQAGQTLQGLSSVAIGNQAGATGQGNNSVAIGDSAGQISQGQEAVAIGNSAGQGFQEIQAVAIGSGAGQTYQKTGAVAIGNQAGQFTQGENSVAIGQKAGLLKQGDKSVAVGHKAGENTQGGLSVAIGTEAGQIQQGPLSVAIGNKAGHTQQGSSSVAIGNKAGQNGQQSNTVAIGDNAGQTNQGFSAVAIGQNAGQTNQGELSVAIGKNAGFLNQHPNSIILNASSAALNSTTTSAFYVNPIRSMENGATGTNMLCYNVGTSEIFHQPKMINTTCGNPTAQMIQSYASLTPFVATGERTYGELFNLSSEITISELSISTIFIPTPGFPTRLVGLWNPAGTLIVSANVDVSVPPDTRKRTFELIICSRSQEDI